MAVAGVLEVQMLANLARLQNDMTKAKGMVGGAMRGVESSVAFAKKAFVSLGLGIGLIGFTRMVKGALAAQDELAKLSQKVGISVESLAGLKHAADLSGLSFEGLQKGIKTLGTQMFDASMGLAESKRNFAVLGIEVKNTDGALKSSEKVMVEIADKFSKMRNPTERAALAVKLFGKAGLDMIPLLNEGSAAIAEMIAEGQRLNPVTAESARQAEIFNDNMTRLKGTTTALGTSLLVRLLPGMSEISEAMREAAKESGILMALWVGLGGAMANLLGMTDAQRTRDRLREINDELAIATKQLAAGTLNPPGANKSFFSFLVPDVALNDAALAKVKATIDTLEKERARLTAVPAAKPVSGTSDLLVKETKSVGDTDSAYRGLLKALKEKLLTDREQTEVTRLQMTLDAMSAKTRATITTERERELMTMARAVDLRNQEKIALEQYIAAIGEASKFRLELAQAIAAEEKKVGDAILATQRNIEQIEFETSIIGQSNVEREIAIALREMETAGIDKQSLAYEQMGISLRAAIITQHQRQELEDLRKKAEDTAKEMGEFAKEAARGIQRGFSDFLFDVMQGKFDNMADRFKQMLDRMVADALAAKLARAVFGDMDKTGNIGGLLGNVIGNIFPAPVVEMGGAASAADIARLIGGAAHGGSFGAGNMAWVGEQGKELVRFNQPATVIPHDQSMRMADGDTIIYMDNRGADSARIAVLEAMFRSQGAAVRSFKASEGQAGKDVFSRTRRDFMRNS